MSHKKSAAQKRRQALRDARRWSGADELHRRRQRARSSELAKAARDTRDRMSANALQGRPLNAAVPGWGDAPGEVRDLAAILDHLMDEGVIGPDFASSIGQFGGAWPFNREQNLCRT